jgi:hypothetical protein
LRVIAGVPPAPASWAAARSAGDVAAVALDLVRDAVLLRQVEQPFVQLEVPDETGDGRPQVVLIASPFGVGCG